MPGGRPSKMNVETLKNGIKNCIREGKSIPEIAELFEVSYITIYRWFEKDPEFSNTINEARENMNDKVEASYYSRTQWDDYTEIREVINSKGEKVELKTHKRLPPDPNVLRTWLMFRRPDKWGPQALSQMVQKEIDVNEEFE